MAQIIRNLDLTDVVWSGDPFTWSNHRAYEHLIRVRLDRALANTRWHKNFPPAQLTNLISIGSNHDAILLVTNQANTNKIRPFRLFEYWLAH